MDKRIENFSFAGSSKLPSKGLEILKREPDEGSLVDAAEMIGNVNLDEFYPNDPKTMKNELLEREKDKKIADLLKHIGELADRTVDRLRRQD